MAAARNSRWARGTWAAGTLAFTATLAMLGAQVSAGEDPVIAAAPLTAPAAAQPRKKIVVTRRIVRTTVITHPAPQPVRSAAVAGSAPVASAPGVSAPAAVAAAPAAAAPAPAAAPPPPPAPVTRAS